MIWIKKIGSDADTRQYADVYRFFPSFSEVLVRVTVNFDPTLLVAFQRASSRNRRYSRPLRPSFPAQGKNESSSDDRLPSAFIALMTCKGSCESARQAEPDDAQTPSGSGRTSKAQEVSGAASPSSARNNETTSY